MQEARSNTVARKLLGSMLVCTGTSHLTFARKAFLAQVPDWVPLEKDDTVLMSGIAEIVLGGALLTAGPKYRKAVAQIAAIFFVAIFPGNFSQYLHRRSAFGLDTDRKRFVRLFLQPVLVCWALKSE